MSIAFSIPAWLLWTLGIAAVVVIVPLAVFGFLALRSLSGWSWGGWS